jgi:hypothetical protein
MQPTAEVIQIDDLRRRRAAREAASSEAPRPSPMPVWVPVWVAWVPFWRAPLASQPFPLLRAGGWSGR